MRPVFGARGSVSSACGCTAIPLAADIRTSEVAATLAIVDQCDAEIRNDLIATPADRRDGRLRLAPVLAAALARMKECDLMR